MNRTLALLIFVLSACGTSGSPNGLYPTDQAVQGLNPVTGFGSNPGQLTMYLYVPTQLPMAHVPVVVAMHGCTQSASAYVGAGWNDLADQEGFLVIYPQTSANGSCFAWWDATQARRDQGQALSIKQMVDYVKAHYDVGGVYVTGLSAGGAMTSVMLAAYPDVFSAGAVMSGIAYRCADSQGDAYTCMFNDRGWNAQKWGDLIRSGAPVSAQSKWPRVSVWQGTSDGVVVPANAPEIVGGWTNVHGLNQTATSSETVGPATHTRYADASGTVQVEEWLMSGMSHGTALDPSHGCGVAGAFMLDEGICSTRYAANFFFGIGTPGNSGTGGGSGAGGGSATGGSGNTGGGSAMNGSGGGGSGTTPPSSCQQFYASNWDHTQAGRAAACQPLNGHACAKGSNDDMGLWNVAQMTWLKETSAGYFEIGQCQ